MSFTLNHAEAAPMTANGPFTFTGYSTAPTDCVVFSLQVQGTGVTVGVSGLGATWTTVQNQTPGGVFQWLVLVGYGATAGNTTISFTGLLGQSSNCVVGVFGGVQSASSPVVASVVTTTTATSITTPSLSYLANELVVGVAAGFSSLGSSLSTPTWSNGATNHVIQTDPGQYSSRGDFLPAPAGSATTYQTSPANNSFLGAMAMNLLPAPSAGNMLLVL